MKRTQKVVFVFISVALISFSSCRWRSVRGNGNVVTETRNEGSFRSVKAAGSFDVYLTQGEGSSIKIETDENLMKYIVTEIKDDVLVIKTKQGVNLRTKNDLKVFLTSPEYQKIEIAGSGNIISESKLSSSEKISFRVAGSGDIKLNEIDAPAVEVKIAGSGKAEASGFTKSVEINVAGSGDVRFSNLKAENAEVHIAGSGNVWVYSSQLLDVHVAGGGDIHYAGNPVNIKKKIAGSGNLIKE
jgi:hypothetical protein